MDPTAYLEYLPTAAVTLILGLIAQRVVREGKKDETVVQQAANRLAETQQLLDAQNNQLLRLNADLSRKDDEIARERTWRLEAEDQARRLRDIVVGQVEVSSRIWEEPPPQPTDRSRS